MWNMHDQEYNRLLKLVIQQGRVKKNRTGVDTRGVFGAQARFNLADGFPLLTTKKVFFKGIVHELLWFLKGDTNIKYLVDNDVHIWDGNCYDRYAKTPIYELRNWEYWSGKGNPLTIEGQECRLFTKEEFIQKIKESDLEEPLHSFSKKWGELGDGTYGGMWRAFPYYTTHKGYKGETPYENMVDIPEASSVDQVTKVINKLRTNPDDRRMIVSAWHPYWVDHCALPPCHVLYHFNTEELTEDERYFELIKRLPWADDCSQTEIRDLLEAHNIPTRRLNCLLYQRSCDLFLGVPFNIASYSLLLQMVAHVTNMVPGEFIHTYGDLHLYSNHMKQVDEQLGRGSFPSPTVRLNPDVKEIDQFKFEDIVLENYQSHATIKAEMAV